MGEMQAVITKGQTITINSRDFGAIEVCEDDILHFPNGIFAFEDVTRFVLIRPLGEDTYPMWLQAVDAVTPCFIVFDPQKIVKEYCPQLSNNERALLKANEDTPLRFLSLAVVHEDYRKTTVNLKSPIAIHWEEKLATQVILPQSYAIRYSIYEQEESV